jgi:hypothetical protein
VQSQCHKYRHVFDVFLQQVFLVLCLTVTLIFAKEVPYRANENLPTTKAGGEVETEPTGPLAVLKGFKDLPPGMPSVLLVTAITWVYAIGHTDYYVYVQSASFWPDRDQEAAIAILYY